MACLFLLEFTSLLFCSFFGRFQIHIRIVVALPGPSSLMNERLVSISVKAKRKVCDLDLNMSNLFMEILCSWACLLSRNKHKENITK
ncbi:hypothetical protein BDF14DRAFT_136968 [Spinellus fusiger]|nr:hypothetical protein BDF14DRAFT_136968 [Spinellus fusiger]